MQETEDAPETMKGTDKVMERLTGQELPKELLGIYKLAGDAGWCRLIMDGKTVHIDDADITWEIDTKLKRVMVDITTKPNTNTYGKCNSATIRGKREHIENLIYSLGMIMPRMRKEPVRDSKQEEDEIYSNEQEVL